MSAVDAENAAAPTTAMVSKPHRLLERAAAVLRWQWPFATMVTFNWWTGNEDQIFRATLEWPRDTVAPRLVVFDGRLGNVVCASLEGQPFQLDPSHPSASAAPDEAARLAAKERGQREAAAARERIRQWRASKRYLVLMAQ